MHAPPGYELRGPLGEGGMGVVYRAVQLKLGREVALKVIGGDGPIAAETTARFLREAQALARVNHPNVVQIYDYGEAGGVPFFAAELCTGGHLRDRMAARRYTPAEAVRLVAVLAEALAAVHREGLIHRDVKPSNILFKQDDTPALGDFGIARGSSRDLTTPGVGMGTYGYMAPEQEAGHPHLTPAVDVYALGVVLHELLTGKLPRRGPNLPATLSPRLRDIVVRCLAEEPAGRYQSAAELAADLRALTVSDEPGTAPLMPRRDDPTLPLSQPRARVWPWLVGAALVLVAFALLGYPGLWRPAPPPAMGGRPPPRTDGPPPAGPAGLEESFAGGIPVNWDAAGFRHGKNDERAFLEPTGDQPIDRTPARRFMTIPLEMKGPFALEVEYEVRGHNGSGWSGVRQEQLFTLVLSGQGREVTVQANYEGQIELADRAPRRPPGHTPSPVARLRLERDGDVYRIYLDGKLAAGARLEAGDGPFDALKIGLTPGLVTRLPAARPARLYSVALRPLEPSPRPTAVIFPIGDVEKAVQPGDMPEGWHGPAFSLLRDQVNVPCFEVTAKAGQHQMRLPKQSIGGDFELTFDFVLHGHNGAGYSGVREEQVLSVELKGPTFRFEMLIDYEGGVTLGRGGAKLRAKVFNVGKLNRFRMVREGPRITQVRINDDPVTNGGVPGNTVETIALGLSAGRVTRTNSDFARLYRVRLHPPGK